MKKESIKLTAAQRRRIGQILSKGKAWAWTRKHAEVLLKVDRGPQGPDNGPENIGDSHNSALSHLRLLSGKSRFDSWRGHGLKGLLTRTIAVRPDPTAHEEVGERCCPNALRSTANRARATRLD